MGEIQRPKLRPYQGKAKADVRGLFADGVRRVVLRSEVGSGKTVVFSDLAHSSVEKGSCVMIVCNRQKLVGQSVETLKRYGLNPYVLMQTGLPARETKLIVASADTLRHRDWPEWVNFVIVDECHLANFTNVLEACVERNVFVLGVSATPIPNKSNRLHEFYQAIVTTLPTSQHIIDGDLVIDYYYAPKSAPGMGKGAKLHRTNYGMDYSEKEMYAVYNKPKVYDDMIENWIRVCRGMKTVCFCISVEHSKNTAENFKRHGISATHLDGSHSEKEREQIQADFEAGVYTVLCNCALFTFGWNCPAVECVIVNRATASYELWRQMIGRGSRPFERADGSKKDKFWVIDQGRNVHKHGSLMNEIEWTLEPPKKKKKGIGVAPMKECPECEALVPTSVMTCPNEGCNHVWEKKGSDLEKSEFEVIVPKMLTTWPAYGDYAQVELYVQDCIRYSAEKKYHKNSVIHHIKDYPDAVHAYGAIR